MGQTGRDEIKHGHHEFQNCGNDSSSVIGGDPSISGGVDEYVNDARKGYKT